LSDDQKSQDEVAAASSSNGKRFVALYRFVSVLLDQTTDANLTPNEMRYVGAVFKNTLDLFASNEQGRL